jgi:antitoxin component YwqK of YwqJK toxin-antitoxin module
MIRTVIFISIVYFSHSILSQNNNSKNNFSDNILFETPIYFKNLQFEQGKYLLNKNPFTGVAIDTGFNGQLKSKFQIVQGNISGLQQTYFVENEFTKLLYFDSLRVNQLNRSISNQVAKINKLIEDSINRLVDLNYFIQNEIGGSKKLDKLSAKFRKSQINYKSMKKRDERKYMEYFKRNNDYKSACNVIYSARKEKKKLIDDLTTEKQKALFIPKINSEYNVENGIKSGNYSMFFFNGIKNVSAYYMDDKLHGQYIEYFENGNVNFRFNYKEGIKDGLSQEYFENGIVKKVTFYSNGQLSGIEKTYNTNGVLISEVGYLNGQLSGIEKTYNSNGVLVSEVKYLNDLKNGICKTYSEDGVILKEEQYVNGRPQGLYAEYFPNGKIKVQATKDTNSIADGYLLGKYSEFFDNGKLKTQKTYDINGGFKEIKPKLNVLISSSEVNKKYTCSCCRKTINGIYDGVNSDGKLISPEMYKTGYENYVSAIQIQFGYTSERDYINFLNQSAYELFVKLCEGFLGCDGSSWKPSDYSYSFQTREKYKYCTLKCAKFCGE